MRITNGMLMKKYTSTLNKSLKSLTELQNQVTTGRKYDKYSQNPISAMRASKLQTVYSNLQSYKSNVSDAENMLSTTESAVIDIHSVIQDACSGDCLQALNASSGTEERAVIATKLRSVQKSIMQTLNTQYSGSYVFGGLNSSEAPFTLDSSGNLLFRGVDINTGKLAGEDGATAFLNNCKISFGKENGDALNDYKLQVLINDPSAAINKAVVNTDNKTVTVNLSAGATISDLQNTLNETSAVIIEGSSALSFDFSKIKIDGDKTKAAAPGASQISDKADLNTLASERFFTDIGIGLRFNEDGSVDEQSAMDISTNGLSLLGFGADADGIPNNSFTLLGQIADKLSSSAFSYDDVQPLIEKLNYQNSSVTLGEITKLGVKSEYIKRMESRFDDSEFNLTVKLDDLEMVDRTEAITNMTMQEYAYRATLQMGSNILQASLLDYLQ